MRSSIQVSARLRRKLEKRKDHPRQPYEEVIEAALDAAPVAGAAGLRAIGLVDDVRASLDELVAALRRRYGDRLVRMILYGSHARGEAHADSDVDVLVVLAGALDRGREIGRVVEITYDILLRHGIHISALPMAEEDFLSRATPLLMNVRREGIPL